MAVMLGNRIFFGYVHMQDYGQFAALFCVQLLLHIGYGSVILLLVHLFQNTVASLITGILATAGILQIVDTVLVSAVPRLAEIENFSIMNFMTSGNVTLVSMTSENSLYMRAAAIAVIVLMTAGSLSSIILEKRDI